jgi:hypothetical protein
MSVVIIEWGRDYYQTGGIIREALSDFHRRCARIAKEGCGAGAAFALSK